MHAFAELLDRLALTKSRKTRLILVRDYLGATPDPDRGWALAALTGELVFKTAKPALIRRVVQARLDPVLFGWSYDYVGDLAETVALSWPTDPDRLLNREPSLSEVVDALATATRPEAPLLIETWLDELTPKARWAFLKLLTGGLRVGLSARLARTAVAMLGERSAATLPLSAPLAEGREKGLASKPVDVSEVEEVWHALTPPYVDLFAWLEGRADRPGSNAPGRFRPVMLAVSLNEGTDFDRLNLTDYLAEWKWDGIRVQAVCEKGVSRLYSRTGDDISLSFPDVMSSLTFEGAVDGELLVIRDGEIAPFGDLQQRLNRKMPDAKLMRSHPAAIMAYDLLGQGDEDLRAWALSERRAALESLVAVQDSDQLRISPLVEFKDRHDLAALRANPPIGAAAEGLMLKRRDHPYVSGRPKGPWFKWKRDPFLIDAVLMYAQRGHGRRSSYYSDFTFGVWDGKGVLSPIGKAYFGFTDEELKALDSFVRSNTVERFGPVRSLRATMDFGLVLEIAFEGLNRSTRHKSGLAMRFPRISRIRWDKPTREADTLENVLHLLRAIESGGGRVA
jgi:DNA ligase-1